MAERTKFDVGIAGAAAALVAAATWFTISGTSSPVDSASPTGTAASDVAPGDIGSEAERRRAQRRRAQRDVQRASFYDSAVAPEIVKTDLLNRQAADRCVARMRAVIRGYRQGVDPFVDDLTSISTRLGIVRRLPGSWWNEDRRIESYIATKFETHLFSKDKLTDDIAAVLREFKSEIDANQRRMLVHVQAALGTADLPEVELESYEPFFQSVATELQQYSARQGAASVANGLTALVAGEAGYYVVATLVGGMLARFGTSAAISTAAGAGATATAGAAGAGGGSVLGPVGTVVGVGVGLAVGMTIDWYMTEQFREQMSGQMLGYLDELEQALLEGSGWPGEMSGSGSRSGAGGGVDSVDGSDPARAPSGRDGMVDALPVVCDDLCAAYRERFYQQIVQPESAL